MYLQLFEVLSGADSGQHEDLGRVHDARRHDDLLLGVHDVLALSLHQGHARGSPVLDQDLQHE